MNDDRDGVGRRAHRAFPDHVGVNRAYWDGMAAAWVSGGELRWSRAEPFWGIWEIPEARLRLLPEDMRGADAIELGCGTAYVSGWMARRGAAVVGVDTSAAQLATARRLMRRHDVELTLVHDNAEAVPYPDASFDMAISEYGAAIWCDPHVWIPEAHRLLRPGGTLVFMGTHPLAVVCTADGGGSTEECLHRSYFDLERQDWSGDPTDPGGIEFNLPISRWIQLFHTTGFEILDYRELRAPEGAADTTFGISAGWARTWPSEQLWRLRKV